jgi:hypothetical protein
MFSMRASVNKPCRRHQNIMKLLQRCFGYFPLETLDKDFTASSCSIRTFFTEKLLSVPAYQREYVWRPKNVLALLDDMVSNYENEQLPMYIGSVICIQKSNNSFEIIDGQQRSVTIYALLAAAVSMLHTHQERAKIVQKYEGLIQFEEQLEGQGSDFPFSPTLNLLYDTERSREVIRKLSENSFEFEIVPRLGTIRGKGNSHLRIEHAANLAYTFLSETFETAEALNRFLQFVIEKVYLVMIVARDESVAMNVFESANGKGVGLDSLDLVKNWLFMNAESSAFDAISQHWQQMKKSIEAADEKPARFLRTYCMSQLALDDYPSEKGDHGIYTWIKLHGDRILGDRKPKDLVSDISDSASMYKKLKSNDEFDDGKRLVGISNIAKWSPSYRLHFVPMLSTKHFSVELRQQIARVFERYVFLRSVSKLKHGGTNEKLWAKFALDLRDLTSSSDIAAWEDAIVQPELSGLREKFTEGFKELSYTNKKKLNYAVRRLYQYVQDKAGQSWSQVWSPSLTLDHIIPCGSPAVRKDPNSALNRIGNIALWSEVDNTGSKHDLPLSIKLPKLATSGLVINQFLQPLEHPEFGRTAIIHKELVEAGLETSGDFSISTIAARTDALSHIAWNCWSNSFR